MTDSILWQSAQNILKSNDTLGLLTEALHLIEYEDEQLSIECDDSDFEGDWVTTVSETYYKVRRRKKNMTDFGWITLAIQLTCDEGHNEVWQPGKRAKVLAGFSPFKSFDYAWGFDASSPDSSGYREGCSVEDLVWLHKDGESWFFAVPLDQLTSRAAVQELVAVPMRHMVAGASRGNPIGELQAEFLGPIKGRLCVPPGSA